MCNCYFTSKVPQIVTKDQIVTVSARHVLYSPCVCHEVLRVKEHVFEFCTRVFVLHIRIFLITWLYYTIVNIFNVSIVCCRFTLTNTNVHEGVTLISLVDTMNHIREYHHTPNISSNFTRETLAWTQLNNHDTQVK